MYVCDSLLVMTFNTTRQISTDGVTVVPHVASLWPPSIVIVEFAAYGTQDTRSVARSGGNVSVEQRLAQVIVEFGGTDGTGVDGKDPI